MGRVKLASQLKPGCDVLGKSGAFGAFPRHEFFRFLGLMGPLVRYIGSDAASVARGRTEANRILRQ